MGGRGGDGNGGSKDRPPTRSIAERGQGKEIGSGQLHVLGRGLGAIKYASFNSEPVQAATVAAYCRFERGVPLGAWFEVTA